MSSSAGIGIICWWYRSKRTFILVKKNVYRSLPGTCMSSSAGIGIICWWYWSKRTFYFSQKKHFSVSTSNLQSQFGWLSPSLEVHIGQKKHVYLSKKIILMCPPRPATSGDVPIPAHARSQDYRPGCWTPSDSPACPCS